MDTGLVRAGDAGFSRNGFQERFVAASPRPSPEPIDDAERWPRLYVSLFVLVTCGSFWIVAALLLRRLLMMF